MLTPPLCSFAAGEARSVWFEITSREELKFWRLVGQVEKRGEAWWGELGEFPAVLRVEEEVRRALSEIGDDIENARGSVVERIGVGKAWTKWLGYERRQGGALRTLNQT